MEFNPETLHRMPAAGLEDQFLDYAQNTADTQEDLIRFVSNFTEGHHPFYMAGKFLTAVQKLVIQVEKNEISFDDAKKKLSLYTIGLADHSQLPAALKRYVQTGAESIRNEQDLLDYWCICGMYVAFLYDRTWERRKEKLNRLVCDD